MAVPAFANDLAQDLTLYKGPKLKPVDLSSAMYSVPGEKIYVPQGNMCPLMDDWQKRTGRKLVLKPTEQSMWAPMIMVGGQGVGWVPVGTLLWFDEETMIPLFMGPLPDGAGVEQNKARGCCNPIGEGRIVLFPVKKTEIAATPPPQEPPKPLPRPRENPVPPPPPPPSDSGGGDKTRRTAKFECPSDFLNVELVKVDKKDQWVFESKILNKDVEYERSYLDKHGNLNKKTVVQKFQIPKDDLGKEVKVTVVANYRSENARCEQTLEWGKGGGGKGKWIALGVIAAGVGVAVLASRHGDNNHNNNVAIATANATVINQVAPAAEAPKSGAPGGTQSGPCPKDPRSGFCIP